MPEKGIRIKCDDDRNITRIEISAISLIVVTVKSKM